MDLRSLVPVLLNKQQSQMNLSSLATSGSISSNRLSDYNERDKTKAKDPSSKKMKVTKHFFDVQLFPSHSNTFYFISKMVTELLASVNLFLRSHR